MLSYVNRHAADELIAPVEAEHDPIVRAEMIRIIAADIHRVLIEQYERTAYELKRHRSWNNGQISELLGISERRAKRLLSDYSKRTGVRHPYEKFDPGTVMDISDLVATVRTGPKKASSQSTSNDVS